MKTSFALVAILGGALLAAIPTITALPVARVPMKTLEQPIFRDIPWVRTKDFREDWNAHRVPTTIGPATDAESLTLNPSSDALMEAIKKFAKAYEDLVKEAGSRETLSEEAMIESFETVQALANGVSVLLVVIPTATSLPHPQVPLSAPELPVQPPLTPGIVRGNSIRSVLHQIASGLSQDYPGDWGKMMKNLTTNGSSSIQTIVPSDLKAVMQTWELDIALIDKAYHDIQDLIRSALEEGVYIAQGLSYSWSHCQGHTYHHICLSTLMVVVRVPYVVSGSIWRAEVGHVYVTSGAKTHICHQRRCGFLGLCKPRCHDYSKDPQKLLHITAVMFASQADWALKHLLKPPADVSFARTDVSHPPSLAASSHLLWRGRFDPLLRLFRRKAAENRDVHQTYRGGLLAAILDPKVLIEFLRAASASSYFNIPVHDKVPVDNQLPSPFQQYQVVDGSETSAAALAMSPSFDALKESIYKYAESWGKVVGEIGSSVNSDVQRRVCLGFDALDYQATSNVLQGVPTRNMPRLVEYVVDREGLPRQEDVKRLMSGVKYSTNFTWTAESMTFTNPAGEQSYFFFAKYGGEEASERSDVVYSSVKSQFVLARDMLVLHRQSSSLWGLLSSEETYIEYVPHTMTLNDTLVLEMYWEMIAFRQIMISLGAEPPKTPDLSGLCNRSMP
ncbi:hypothetical protein BGZ90_008435 [Linnemannia elongata]|nr:hypothetical protein BGZ90_008435 [Linnemannia elongata]